MDKLSKKERKELNDTKLDRMLFMDEQVTNGQVSDAVKVGFIDQAIKLFRYFKEHGVPYDTSSNFATLTANKAGVTDLKSPRKARVVNESSADADALDTLEGEGGITGGEVKAVAAKGKGS